MEGVYLKCKSTKNFFEGTRRVKNRMCFFSNEDKNKINKKTRYKNLINQFLLEEILYRGNG